MRLPCATLLEEAGYNRSKPDRATPDRGMGANEHAKRANASATPAQLAAAGIGHIVFFGSNKRIEREIRRRFPLAVRKCVVVEAGMWRCKWTRASAISSRLRSAKISGGSRNLGGDADLSQDLRPKGSI